MTGKFRMRTAAAICAALAAIVVLGLPAESARGQGQAAENPYSPAYGHPYRHGAVPTRAVWQKMRQWRAAHAASGALAPAASSGTLTYGGGINGVGVTSSIPRVYLIFWGAQWANGGDPNGAATYLQHFYAGIGTGGETWSGTMTQYCDGTFVAAGASSCPGAAGFVGYPSSGALAEVWFDTSASAPASATQAQIAAEAIAAAAHFGNTSAAANRYAQYVIASPSGTAPDNFPASGFCAWHNYTTSSYGDIAYTNLPYQSDAGAGCGVDFVNSGSLGTLDGFSIVGGHEYAETLTDQFPLGGWCDSAAGCGTHEDGDECAWISPGLPGGASNVSMGNGAYAMQSTWSNDTNACEISHTILHDLGEPGRIAVTKTYCDSQYDLQWSSVPGATSYDLWTEPAGAGYVFGPTSIVGTGTTVTISKGQSYSYLVQACNGSNCGAITPPTAALPSYSGPCE